ncbi:MAG: iron chelate uptake ABC transporter family permease subunit, partial [Lutispora sp.]
FGLISVFITYTISRNIKGRDATLMLVLTGILVGTIFSSLVSLTKLAADPYGKLPEITFWLMYHSSIFLRFLFLFLT